MSRKPHVLIISILLFGVALPSMAATSAVTSLADDGSPGTLRCAIANANSGDTINFSVTGTITLTQGPLAIFDKNLTIGGPSAARLAISGNNLSEVFLFGTGITETISGVTIQSGFSDFGGGTYIYGNSRGGKPRQIDAKRGNWVYNADRLGTQNGNPG